MHKEQHPKSKSGSFYFNMDDGGCCCAGGAPHLTAPDLFAYEDVGKTRYCYVKKQPETDFETYMAIRAAWCTEFECLRYSGRDEDTLRRFAEIGLAQVCDHPVPESAQETLHTHVTFRTIINCQTEPTTLFSLAKSLRSYLMQGYPRRPHYATELNTGSEGITFSYAWLEPNYHPILVQETNAANTWLISHSPFPKAGSLGVGWKIDDYLRQNSLYDDICWYTMEEWNNGGSGRPTPF
jgi:hypothetical protein